MTPEKMFGFSKLVNYVDEKMVTQIDFWNNLTLNGKLNVFSLEVFMEIAQKPINIILNIQCGGNLILLGLHEILYCRCHH